MNTLILFQYCRFLKHLDIRISGMNSMELYWKRYRTTRISDLWAIWIWYTIGGNIFHSKDNFKFG